MTGPPRTGGPRERLVLWAPVLLLLALEAFLSSQSHLPRVLPRFVPDADKVLHAGYFFLVGLAAARAGLVAEGWSRRGTLLAIALGVLAWGVSDEWHQSFVPGRDVETADVVADVVGATLGAALAAPLLARLRRPA